MPPTLATASIQGVGLLLSMDQRSAWPAAVRTDKRSGIKAKLSPRSGSALTSAHSVCILCFVNCHLDMFHCNCWRPYHVECTGSLLTSEVKRHRARLVLGWGTAWEDLRVLSAFPTALFKLGRLGRPWGPAFFCAGHFFFHHFYSFFIFFQVSSVLHHRRTKKLEKS